MKKLFCSWKYKFQEEIDFEMGKERRYWNTFYKPDQDVYWFQVPKTGSMKYSYDKIVHQNCSRHWNIPSLPSKRLKEDQVFEQEPVILEDVKPGSIILFGIPNKIVDLFLISSVKNGRIFLSPIFFTMVWRDTNIIAPIPDCCQHPHRNHPVKLDDGNKFRDYIKKNKDTIFQEVYSWES